MARLILMKLVWLVSLLMSTAVVAADYAGSDNCQFCHQQQYRAWKDSDHFRAMQLPTPKTVLGDFSGESLQFHGIPTRYFLKSGLGENQPAEYFVETLDKDGKLKNWPILYTFGHYPLQQYIVDIGDGHKQVLNVAWDSRPKEQGGQRWFHLQPDENIKPEHPFYWAGHFQNWNSRCADCHSTGLEKNYQPASHSYDTQYAEVNVACEACHGPAGKHIELARTGKLRPGESNGFTKSPTEYSFIDMCGACHSRRSQIGKGGPLSDFHQNYRLQTLEPGLYHHDGQIDDEVFVLGSFLQSKMAELGVTCTNCHEPHSGKLLKQGDALCQQCHSAELFQPGKHPKSVEPAANANAAGNKASTGGCVDCHMPAKTYMQVDPRRDHRFHMPRQQAEAWAEVNRLARGGDSTVNSQLAEIVSKNDLPAIIRATLFNQMARFPSPVTLQAAEAGLQDQNPLVRRAALAALQYIPLENKLTLLQRMQSDKDPGVQMELAVAWLDHWPELSKQQRLALSGLLVEYRQRLVYTEDTPGGQLALAYLSQQQADYDKAEQAYLQALKIAPAYVPALLNIADFYRLTEREDRAEVYLQKALQVAPYSADVQHANGLYQVRKGDYQAALAYLEKAVRQQDASSRHVYVYAVALDHQGEVEQAIKVLQAADKRWPNQYELIHLLVQLMRKTGQHQQAEPYLEQLRQFAR